MIQGTFSLVVLGSCILVLNACQILSLVVRLFSSRAFYWLNRTFAGWFWGLCVFFMERIWRVEILQSGDPIPPGEKVILFCNHQQMPDVLALMPLAKKKQRLPDLKWFVKDPIKWVPGVGWGMLFFRLYFPQTRLDARCTASSKDLCKSSRSRPALLVDQFFRRNSDHPRKTPEKPRLLKKKSASGFSKCFIS